jgi:hypothetical protein
MTLVRQGGCLCGAVRFQVSGPANWTAYCHCQSCRKHTGAPVSAYAGFDRVQVTVVKGEISRFASSPCARRGFCPTCGSTLSYEGDRWPTELHIHIGAFDEPEAFAPESHAFEEERLSWLHMVGPQN